MAGSQAVDVRTDFGGSVTAIPVDCPGKTMPHMKAKVCQLYRYSDAKTLQCRFMAGMYRYDDGWEPVNAEVLGIRMTNAGKRHLDARVVCLLSKNRMEEGAW